MTDKACPRCGALYQDLKSTTCPQCFARLIAVDEQTAQELAAARAEIEATPEFQEAKAEDDERFREQSFGACLGVAVIVLLTAIVSVGLVVHAYHRYGHAPSHQSSSPNDWGPGGLFLPPNLGGRGGLFVPACPSCCRRPA